MSAKPRVLVVDDDRRMARTLVDILRVKGFEVQEAHSGSEALERLKAAGGDMGDRFDCILTDVKMPDMDGTELNRRIKVLQPQLPVVMMTAYVTNAEFRTAEEEGAWATLNKPVEIELLLSFLAALREEQAVVIIDDDPTFLKTTGDILRLRGFAVTLVEDPSLWEVRIESEAQIVLLDLKLNGLTGQETLRRIRKKYPRQPVVLVTGYRQEMAEVIVAGLKSNAYTCLYKPLAIDELIQVLDELRQQGLKRLLRRSAP